MGRDGTLADLHQADEALQAEADATVGSEESGGGRRRGGRKRVVLPADRQGLVSRHIALVGMHLRNRVPTPREPMRYREYDDLFQEGCVALVRAAAQYDPARHGEFGSYALFRIRGGIHAALHERFSTIRVPAGAASESRGLEPRSAGEFRSALSEDLPLEAPDGGSTSGTEETVRHVLRRRFERAFQRAMMELRNRPWRRRNPCDIMARLGAERLLICRESERTPLRQIARESSISSGRASAYEQLLFETVAKHFTGDPQVPLLIEFARQGPGGFSGLVDARRRELLVAAELREFEDRFGRLQRSARAELLYEMVERSANAVAEVARNLYRLTLSDGIPLLTDVA